MTKTTNGVDPPSDAPSPAATVILAWLAVGAPLLWGVAQTIRKALSLFG